MILDKSLLNLLCLTLCWTLLSSNVSAQEIDSSHPIPIKWEKLGPNGGKPFNDPFSKLSSKQLADLSYIARIQRLISEEKIKADGIDAKEASQLAASLEKDGIEIDWLLQQRKRVIQIREKQVDEIAETIANSLKEMKVELTGYAVPIKMEGTKVKEFFLVPTLASCSHEDAPPRLQVVHVSTNTGISSFNSRTPVRVSGKIRSKTSETTIINGNGKVKIYSAYEFSSPQIEFSQIKQPE